MIDYIVYGDGGSRGNPGIAGSGALLTDSAGKVLKKGSEFLGKNTNNFAEYRAVLLGFSLLRKFLNEDERKNARIEFRLDSELVVRQLNGQYRVKNQNLKPLFTEIKSLMVSEFPKVTFKHIPRSENSEADALANEAMDREANS